MQIFLRLTFLLFCITTGFSQVNPPVILLPDTICTGTAETFTAIVTDSSHRLLTPRWQVSPSTPKLISKGVNDTTVAYSFPKAGNFRIIFDLLDTNDSVIVSAARIVPVAAQAKAAFNASLNTTGFPNQLVLTNYSQNRVKNLWMFSNASEPDTAFHIVRNYPASGAYSVTLLVEGRNGCNDRSSYSFFISDSSGITLPNIFTPNGDGVNDVYRPFVRGVTKLLARIYNRDGIIVASWDRVNGFWDGRNISGEPHDEGVYFITVEATGFDGRTFNNKGSVTLVR